MSTLIVNSNNLSANTPLAERIQPIVVQRFSYYTLSSSEKVSDVALNFFKNIANYLISAANYLHSWIYSKKEIALTQLQTQESNPLAVEAEDEEFFDAVDDGKEISFKLPATQNAEHFCIELEKKECFLTGQRNLETSFSKEEQDLLSSLYLKTKTNKYLEQEGLSNHRESEKMEALKKKYSMKEIKQIHEELSIKLSNLSDEDTASIKAHLVHVTASKKHEILGFILGFCSFASLKYFTSYSFVYTLAEKVKEYETYGPIARGALAAVSFANKALNTVNFLKFSKQTIQTNPHFKIPAALFLASTTSSVYGMTQNLSHAIADQVPFISAKALSAVGSRVCSAFIGKNQGQKKSVKRGFDAGLEKANNLYIGLSQLIIAYSLLTAAGGFAISAIQNYQNTTNNP
jgi:hypothetical protein